MSSMGKVPDQWQHLCVLGLEKLEMRMEHIPSGN